MLKKFFTSIVLALMVSSLVPVSALAATGAELAKQLELNAGKKAIRQWERIFKKKSRWKKFGLDKLSDVDREELKKYLLDHAADSDQPAAAGIY